MNRVSARALVVRCRDWYRVLISIFDFSFAIGLRYARHFSFALSRSFSFHFLDSIWICFFISLFIFPFIALCHSLYCLILLVAFVHSCHLHCKIRRKTILYRRNAEDFFFSIFFHSFSHQFFSVFIYFYLVNLQHNGLFRVITFFSTIFS